MYNKNSGIYNLLKDYLPIYAKNGTWIMSLIISTTLSFLIIKTTIPLSFILKILKLGLAIFPPIFALSLTSMSFLLGLYDRVNLKKLREIDNEGNSLYKKIVMSFMFFVFTIALTIAIYWISNLLVEINYILVWLNKNLCVSTVLVFIYTMLSLLVIFTALDIVSSLYSFFRVQMYLIEKNDKDS